MKKKEGDKLCYWILLRTWIVFEIYQKKNPKTIL